MQMLLFGGRSLEQYELKSKVILLALKNFGLEVKVKKI